MEMLGLVREILPLITSLVTRSSQTDDNNKATLCEAAAAAADCDKTDKPHRYHAVVESDHPYKPAAMHNYRVIVLFLLT